MSCVGTIVSNVCPGETYAPFSTVRRVILPSCGGNDLRIGKSQLCRLHVGLGHLYGGLRRGGIVAANGDLLMVRSGFGELRLRLLDLRRVGLNGRIPYLRGVSLCR